MASSIVPDAHQTIRFTVLATGLLLGAWLLTGEVRSCTQSQNDLLSQQCPAELKRCQAGTATVAQSYFSLKSSVEKRITEIEEAAQAQVKVNYEHAEQRIQDAQKQCNAQIEEVRRLHRIAAEANCRVVGCSRAAVE